MMSPVNIMPQDKYFRPQMVMTFSAMTLAAPLLATSLPIMAPEASVTMIEPNISPTPFCKDFAMLSKGIPKSNPAPIAMIKNEMKGDILHTDVSTVRPIMTRRSTRKICMRLFYIYNYFVSECLKVEIKIVKLTRPP